VLRRADAPVLGAAVNLPQPANANVLAEIDMAGNSGGAGVEPVGILRGELLGRTGLHEFNPA
jgi:hypothetical protein